MGPDRARHDGRGRTGRRRRRSWGESVRLEGECAEIVKRVADEKGWSVAHQVRVTPAQGEAFSRVFDFVITTPKGEIFIESVNFRTPEALSEIVAAVTNALRDQKFLAAFLVVPSTKSAAAYGPENVDIIPIGDLERRLREIPE